MSHAGSLVHTDGCPGAARLSSQQRLGCKGISFRSCLASAGVKPFSHFCKHEVCLFYRCAPVPETLRDAQLFLGFSKGV